MTFLTNLFFAVPTFGWAMLAIAGLISLCVTLYETRTATKQTRVRLWLRDATLLTLAVVVILTVSSPKVWLSKESTKSIDKLSTNSLELKLDDELRGSQQGVDRVPVPKQRENFKHDLAIEKEKVSIMYSDSLPGIEKEAK